LEWEVFFNGLTGFTAGFIAFLIVAAVLVHYLPESGLFRGLKLAAAPAGVQLPVAATGSRPSGDVTLAVGQRGRVVSILRPAGQARFDDLVVDVVSQGDFVQEGAHVEILEIHGNRVVVRAC
jgi:membrane-bound serine protease (ClpP class)